MPTTLPVAALLLHLTREDADTLSSVAVDFSIMVLVDGTVGVHGLIPKSIFKASIH